jgi:hypothetical protein
MAPPRRTGDPGFGTFRACRARLFGINAAFLPIENPRWQAVRDLRRKNTKKIKLFNYLWPYPVFAGSGLPSTGRELNHPVTMFSNQRLTVF